jgi:magnesium transporter
MVFSPEDDAEKAARPSNVTTWSVRRWWIPGKLMGRLTIDEIVDVVYEETDNDLRAWGPVRKMTYTPRG